jgi:DNA-binding MarR family transcriptional regulator
MRGEYNHNHLAGSTNDVPGWPQNAVKKMIQFDDHFRATLRLSALRPDARFLMAVLMHGPISIKEAMLDSELSYRAFYTMIDRLKGQGLIEVTEDLLDRRVRRITACTALTIAIDSLVSNLSL